MSRRDLARLEHQVGRVLRGGVALSATALSAGLLLFFAALPGSRGTLDAGLIVLMAIPVTRIVASFADACRRRDHLLIWSTAFVLLVMLATVVFSVRA